MRRSGGRRTKLVRQPYAPAMARVPSDLIQMAIDHVLADVWADPADIVTGVRLQSSRGWAATIRSFMATSACAWPASQGRRQETLIQRKAVLIHVKAPRGQGVHHSGVDETSHAPDPPE